MSVATGQFAGSVKNPGAYGQEARPRHLFGPVTDFLCLGGISLLLFPVILLLPEKEFTPAFKAFFLAVAYVVNYPHFAFSYQLFYENFRDKAGGRAGYGSMRFSFLFAGIVVPAGLIVFFLACLATGDVRTLGLGANLMVLLVGWHYVKQGYGMLMVDAALKRRFFSDAEKRILLVNCYAVWALAWMLVNTIYEQRGLWGIRYVMFDIPSPLLAAALCAAVATTAATLFVLVGKCRATRGQLPWSGVAAYLVTLYLWLLVMHWNALWLLVVPTLHSLQYLMVVARYRINRVRDAADAAQAPVGAFPFARFFGRRDRQRFAGFVALGVLLGYVGFIAAPDLLGSIVPYDRSVFGPNAMLFVFWIFINVHHYFLDNVMWRSRSADMRKYLFA